MNHTTDELESLILKNCSEMKFEYGGDSATFGNADCRIMLRKTNDDSPMYSGVVCTNHRIDDESRQLAYEVSLSNGDVLACGRLSGGGRFVFPHSTAADGHECRLTINCQRIQRLGDNLRRQTGHREQDPPRVGRRQARIRDRIRACNRRG